MNLRITLPTNSSSKPPGSATRKPSTTPPKPSSPPSTNRTRRTSSTLVSFSTSNISYTKNPASKKMLNSYTDSCIIARMKGRPRVPYLRVDFKISLPAALAAEIDLIFEDPLTKRPKYGARAKLISTLLQRWLDEQRGAPSHVHIPSLEELRDA